MLFNFFLYKYLISYFLNGRISCVIIVSTTIVCFYKIRITEPLFYPKQSLLFRACKLISKLIFIVFLSPKTSFCLLSLSWRQNGGSKSNCWLFDLRVPPFILSSLRGRRSSSTRIILDIVIVSIYLDHHLDAPSTHPPFGGWTSIC